MRCLWVIFLCWLSISAAPAASAETPQTNPFVVETLADGIWLLSAAQNPATHSNSLVIDLGQKLVVIDSQPTLVAADQLLAKLADFSQRPIGYLVLTHAHSESSGGASRFPGSTVVVSTLVTQQALLDEQRDLGAEMRIRAGDAADWQPPPRVRPEVLVTSRTLLSGERNVVELLTIAQGHYPGFLVARIEASGVMYAGSMICPDRNPYADLEYTRLRPWVMAINGIISMKPTTVVPARGSAVDTGTVRKFRDSLTWAIGRVEEAFIEQVPIDEALSFAMDSPELSQHFDTDAIPFLAPTVFERAVAEAAAQRRKRSDY